MATNSVPSIPGFEGLRSVGSEGQAEVFRGTEVETDELVEVMLFPAGASGDRVDRTLARLEELSEHPNVLPVLTHGTTPDGRPYLVVPASQASLADRMISGPQPWHEVAGEGVRIASALASAHRLGLVHGGLTPASVKLSSFGDPQVGGFAIGTEDLDPTGGPLELLAFQSPARLEGAPAEPTDDVYSLGAVVAALVTGAPPFLRPGDKSIVPVVKRVAADPVPDLRAHGVPEQVAALVERAMAKTPAGRPSSAEEFGRSLQQAQVALGVPVTEMSILGDAPPPAATATAPVAAPPPPPPPAGATTAAAAAGGPPSGAPAGGAPGGPPPGGAPGGPPGGAAKPASEGGKKTGLIVAGVLAVLLLIGGGAAIALLGGGDDEKKDDKKEESALDRLDIDEEEDEDDEEADADAEEEVEPEPVEEADPAAGQVALSEAQLLAARLAPEDLPESFKVFEDNQDPIEDLDLCNVEVDVATIVGQRSISYEDEASGQLVVSTVAQFTGDTAAQYMAATRDSLATCQDDEARIVESVPAELGDEGLVVQLVIAEGQPEQIHVFFVFTRIADTVSFTGHVIPSTEQTPPTELSGELAGRALIRLRAAVQTA